MKIRLHRRAPKAEARVLPLAEGQPVPEGMRAAAAANGFTGRAGDICDVLSHPERTVLAGLGAGDARSAEAAGAAAAAHLTKVHRIALDARGLPAETAMALVTGACLRAWRYDAGRTVADADAPRLSGLDLLVDDPPSQRPLFRRTKAVLHGVVFARDLVAEPANSLTPAAFCARLQKLIRRGLTLEVLKPKELRRQGLGALLAVGGGSANAPRLAVLRWAGTTRARPVVFIGKGITFDTGGICIKPADKMWEMRADMAGAAACVGAILALALRESPAPCVAVLPLAENTTGAASYRPGDVLHVCDGTTVEVIDTDAEGRLVLADALAWARKEIAPRAIVDLATLTGSIVVALGHHMAGLFANDGALAAQVAAAGAAAGEPVWHMPIAEAHRDDLKSDIADLKNCLSGRLLPDACHAAAFLQNFAGETAWAHLDIAGVESREEADERHAAGPTGFGVRLLDQLVSLAFEKAEV